MEKQRYFVFLDGFLEADEGVVIFDDEDIKELPPYKRELNTVFQK